MSASLDPREETAQTLVLVVQGSAPARSGRIALGGDPVLIGRGEAVALRVDDGSVSLLHAQVRSEADFFIVKDLASSNGTYVNGVRVVECPISAGDRIRLGRATVAVERDARPVRLDSTIVIRASEIEGALAPSAERIEMSSLRSELDAAWREDDRLPLVWEAGERIAGLADREAFLGALIDLALRLFAPARALILEPVPGGGFACRVRALDGLGEPDVATAERAIATSCAILSVEALPDAAGEAAESARAARPRTSMVAPLLADPAFPPVIHVERAEGPALGRPDLRLLALLAGHVAPVLRTADLVAELRRRNDELSKLNGALERQVWARPARQEPPSPLASHLGFLSPRPRG